MRLNYFPFRTVWKEGQTHFFRQCFQLHFRIAYDNSEVQEEIGTECKITTFGIWWWWWRWWYFNGQELNFHKNNFDVHVTVHRDKFLTIKPTTCINFSNLFLERKLFMFRKVPLSVISFLLYTQQWYMSYRFADSLQAGSGWNWVPSWSCS